MVQQLLLDEAQIAHSKEWPAKRQAVIDTFDAPVFNRLELEREYDKEKRREAEEERQRKLEK
jgi:hypothetical protein